MSETADLAAIERAVVELKLAVGQLRRRLRTEGNPRELNLSQLGTMVRLEQRGWTTTAELARLESMKPQSMGAVLTSLEEDGLVQRRPHPTDGRQIQFALTKTGLQTRRQRAQSKQEWLMTAMMKLSASERRRLIEAIPLIKKLGDND